MVVRTSSTALPAEQHIFPFLVRLFLVLILVVLLLLVLLLLLLRGHAGHRLVVQFLRLLVLLDVHQVDFLDLKVQVCNPRVEVFHHGHLNLVKFVDSRVDVSEEEWDLEEALVQSEVRIIEREDAPANDVVARHEIRLQKDELELQAICGFELGGDHDWNHVLDLEVLVQEAAIKSGVLRGRLIKIELNIFLQVDWFVIVSHIALFDHVFAHLGFVVFESVGLEEILPRRRSLNVLVLTRSIFLYNLPVLSVEELAFFQTKLAQVSREEPVLLFCASRVELDAITANSVKRVADDQVVPAADLILEAASDAKLDKNSLRQLLLNLDHRLHEFVTVWIQLRIDFEDGLLDALGIEHDRTVAARDDFFLLSDALNKGIDRGLEAVLEHLLLHLEFLLGSLLFAFDQVFELNFAFIQVLHCRLLLLLDERVFVRDDPLIMLLLLGSGLVLLLFVLLEVILGHGHDLNGFFSDFLLREGCRGGDVCYVLRILDVEQLVVFLNQLVRLERAELEVAEQGCLLVFDVIIEDAVSLLLTPAPIAVAVTATAFARLVSFRNIFHFVVALAPVEELEIIVRLEDLLA